MHTTSPSQHISIVASFNQAEKDYSTSGGASSERRGAAPPPATALGARRARNPRPARASASRRPPAGQALPPAEVAVGCRRTMAEKILFQNLTYFFFLPCRSFIMHVPVQIFGPPPLEACYIISVSLLLFQFRPWWWWWSQKKSLLRFAPLHARKPPARCAGFLPKQVKLRLSREKIGSEALRERQPRWLQAGG